MYHSYLLYNTLYTAIIQCPVSIGICPWPLQQHNRHSCHAVSLLLVHVPLGSSIKHTVHRNHSVPCIYWYIPLTPLATQIQLLCSVTSLGACTTQTLYITHCTQQSFSALYLLVYAPDPFSNTTDTAVMQCLFSWYMYHSDPQTQTCSIKTPTITTLPSSPNPFNNTMHTIIIQYCLVHSGTTTTSSIR